MLNLARCEVCDMVHDFRGEHECKKEFMCKFCSGLTIFDGRGNLEKDFHWVCSTCDNVHIPLFMTWEKLFGFPSWMKRKDWDRFIWMLENRDKAHNKA